MSLGVSLAALLGAQAGAAYALWPSKLVPVPPAKGIQSERINELVQGKADLADELTTVRTDRDRLAKNEEAAIKAKDEIALEKGLLEAKVAELELKCTDLKGEAVRHRKAAVRASVEAAAKKREEGG